MPRGLDAATLAALNSNQVRLALFCSAQFASETIYVWTGYGPKSWNGQAWQGIGALGKITFAAEGIEVRADMFQVGLTGVPTEYLADCINEFQYGAPAQIWFACLDENNNVIGTPQIASGGRMDVPLIEEGAATCTITISVETRLVDLQRPRLRVYSHEDQQIDWPGDLGFYFVPYSQLWSGNWEPSQPPSTGIKSWF